jgi:hypothetical protein
MFLDDNLINHIQTNNSIDVDSLIVAEWNQNSLLNIENYGNYRWRPESQLFNDIKYTRKAGVELNPKQYTKEILKSRIGDFETKDFSKRIFETQYQQNPQPATGQLMKAYDFLFYDQKD